MIVCTSTKKQTYTNLMNPSVYFTYFIPKLVSVCFFYVHDDIGCHLTTPPTHTIWTVPRSEYAKIDETTPAVSRELGVVVTVILLSSWKNDDDSDDPGAKRCLGAERSQTRYQHVADVLVLITNFELPTFQSGFLMSFLDFSIQFTYLSRPLHGKYVQVCGCSYSDPTTNCVSVGSWQRFSTHTHVEVICLSYYCLKPLTNHVCLCSSQFGWGEKLGEEGTGMFWSLQVQ